MGKNHIHKHFSSSQVIILGFLAAIITGALLLMLPWASTAKGSASPVEALFTATSAVCVTGLIVRDTATYWTGFGQAVILLLIQIGGMGIVTLTVSIVTLSGRKIGLMQRSTMQEAISAPQVGGIVRLTGFILKTTLFVEGLGAALMAPYFIKEFGPGKGLWYAVFHSISAFCNAGFDLMGIKTQFSSLTSYATHPAINIIIMTLIVVGGIGFLTWDDFFCHRLHFKKYRMQSKVIITTTLILLIFPAIYFYFGEFTRSIWHELPTGEKVLASIFQSVTPRTAGFNTVDLALFTEAGQFIMILLMLIGGSPGSTAGGMKTTTIAVLIASAFSVFSHKSDTNFFGRRISNDVILHASTILMMYIFLCISGGIIISCAEDIPIVTSLFESASAIGTVGLTLGITPSLGLLSRLVLIILMFLGRVGGLTLVFAAVSGTHKHFSRLPQEKLTVG